MGIAIGERIALFGEHIVDLTWLAVPHSMLKDQRPDTSG